MVTLMRPLCSHANGVGQALGGMAGGRHFRKADAGRDLREAYSHEIGQKRASPHNFDNYWQILF